MRKLLAVIALVASTTITGVAFAAPANAGFDSPGCVTRTEFRQIHKGMSISRVVGILDANGTQTDSFNSGGGFAGQTRVYRTCTKPRSSFAGIVYSKTPNQPWKVYAKSSFFA